MKIGVLTYDYAHLKTEQLVLALNRKHEIQHIELFALPFKSRAPRPVLISHRPDQSRSVPTECLGALEKVNFRRWDGTRSLGSAADLFLVAGAGIVDVAFAEGKPIINAHPGILPTCRGLDAFKWAIYYDDPLGVTLHMIDNQVDRGDIILVERTPVFESDSLESLARRHYEVEIDLLKAAPNCVERRDAPQGPERDARGRMSPETEKEMVRRFDAWKERMARPSPN